MKLLILSSLAYSLINFRGELLAALVAAGHEVVACAPDRDVAVEAALTRIGVGFRQTAMDRTGLNPLADLATLRAYIAVIREEAPDVVLAYTQKPIIYGGIACRLAHSPARFHAMVTGLGHIYSSGGGWLRHMIRPLVSRLYRIALAKAQAVYTFNRDDGVVLRRERILSRDRPVVQLPGSGVDIERFTPVPFPDGAPVFLMIARLMRDKGIADYAAAAHRVRKHHPTVRFLLVGPPDPNPTGVSMDEVTGWERAGDIEYLGETRDVVPFLAAAHVFVLPSYYREGLPRTILEAMAMGRPVITTDMPGCREPIRPWRNGILVPPRNAGALADAMTLFVTDPALIVSMGARARALAEDRYDVRRVNARLIGHLEALPTPLPHHGTRRRAWAEFGLAERAAATLLALVTFPVMLVAAMVVRLSIGRPILFRQRRSGRHGASFEMIKFRTMRDARDSFGHLLPDAARLTWTGRLLRRIRLDELPSLWNVMRGDMSLIGPRPLLIETVAAMGEAGVARGAVRPGLTGWAQVNGNALLSDRDKLALDLWYIKERSLSLDLAIIGRTLAVMVIGERISAPNIERGHAGFADRRR